MILDLLIQYWIAYFDSMDRNIMNDIHMTYPKKYKKKKTKYEKKYRQWLNSSKRKINDNINEMIKLVKNPNTISSNSISSNSTKRNTMKETIDYIQQYLPSTNKYKYIFFDKLNSIYVDIISENIGDENLFNQIYNTIKEIPSNDN